VTLPPAAAEDYEALRAAALAGQASAAGLGAIVYHGLIEGLAVLRGTAAASGPVPARTRSPAPVVPVAAPRGDPQLLRLLANMVLQMQTEVRHVY
jgi:hypothetical protein